MAGRIQTYRDLMVWQKAMALVTEVYRLSRRFPKEEVYGLMAQMRRCAVSIPSSIAEGYGRNSTPDYVRFLRMAAGALYELQTQIEVALNLEYVRAEVVSSLYEHADEIAQMLGGLFGRLDGNATRRSVRTNEA
ncbi:MAG: four helix bundle protein [Phycisphaerae bacterium]|nr:four helix bundle protein [Phycisphaerae bacterium]